MTNAPSDNGEGVRFFGTVSASVSHEIKNVFAVINEAAGLLEDFTMMAERGMPIDPERLKRAAQSIQGQVRRGDAIVKNMNAFAHSSDAPEDGGSATDLTETLRLAVTLFTRMAEMQQLTLTLGRCAAAVSEVNGFELIRLLHRIITGAFANMAPGDMLTATVAPGPTGARFVLSAPGRPLSPPEDEAFATLARRLDAVAETDNSGALVLILGR
jgi:hypothetical protein